MINKKIIGAITLIGMFLMVWVLVHNGGVNSSLGAVGLALCIGAGVLLVTLWQALQSEKKRTLSLDLLLEEQQAWQDDAAIGVALILDHCIVRCNRGLNEMMGYHEDDLTGLPVSILFPSLNVYEQASQAVNQALDHETRVTGEMALKQKDGTLLWCYYLVKRNPDKIKPTVTVVLHDINARKLVEASLKQAMQEQQAIFDNAHAGIVFLKDRVVQRCNTAFEMMLGYAPGELTGKSARVYYPNDQLWLAHGILWYPSSSLPQSFDEEWQYKRKDGSLIWCSIHSKLIDPKDSSKGVIALNIDITARKQSQATLVEAKKGLTRSLLEVAEQKASIELAHRNISILSEIGRKVTATLDTETIMNIAYRHVRQLMVADIFGFGIRQGEAGVLDCGFNIVQGQRCVPYTRILSNQNQLSIWCMERQSSVFINDIKSDISDYLECDDDVELNLLQFPDQGPIPTPQSLIYVPLIVNERVLGVIRVGSFNKNAYQRVHLDMLTTLASYAAIALDNADTFLQLQSAQQQLVFQEKMASLGTLTAGVAHEINNPANFAHLGVFNLKTELVKFHQFLMELAGDDAPPSLMERLSQRILLLNEHLDTIAEGTTRIRDLVKDLRTFSRLDEAEWKAVSIIDSLRATINLVRTQYATIAEIQCQIDSNPVLDCWPAQLNQVFMNLIVNACQAIAARQQSGPFPGKLLIRSRQEQSWLVLEFEDNGGGMSSEVQEHIFEPFFTTKSVGEGTGLGLSISFGIIEKHRGQIQVRSVEGEGTCFTLRLPLSSTLVKAAE